MIIPPNRQDKIVEDGRESPKFAQMIEDVVDEVNTLDATNTAIATNATAIAVITANINPYAETNVTPDRTFDADTVAVAELADVVGTLIVDLRAAGIIP